MGGQNAIQNLHQICKLCKKTGFIPNWYPTVEKKNWFINVEKEVARGKEDGGNSAKICFTRFLFERMEIDSKLIFIRNFCYKINSFYKR